MFVFTRPGRYLTNPNKKVHKTSNSHVSFRLEFIKTHTDILLLVFYFARIKWTCKSNGMLYSNAPQSTETLIIVAIQFGNFVHLNFSRHLIAIFVKAIAFVVHASHLLLKTIKAKCKSKKKENSFSIVMCLPSDNFRCDSRLYSNWMWVDWREHILEKN